MWYLVETVDMAKLITLIIWLKLKSLDLIGPRIDMVQTKWTSIFLNKIGSIVFFLITKILDDPGVELNVKWTWTPHLLRPVKSRILQIFLDLWNLCSNVIFTFFDRSDIKRAMPEHYDEVHSSKFDHTPCLCTSNNNKQLIVYLHS